MLIINYNECMLNDRSQKSTIRNPIAVCQKVHVCHCTRTTLTPVHLSLAFSLIFLPVQVQDVYVGTDTTVLSKHRWRGYTRLSTSPMDSSEGMGLGPGPTSLICSWTVLKLLLMESRASPSPLLIWLNSWVTRDKRPSR